MTPTENTTKIDIQKTLKKGWACINLKEIKEELNEVTQSQLHRSRTMTDLQDAKPSKPKVRVRKQRAHDDRQMALIIKQIASELPDNLKF